MGFASHCGMFTIDLLYSNIMSGRENPFLIIPTIFWSYINSQSYLPCPVYQGKINLLKFIKFLVHLEHLETFVVVSCEGRICQKNFVHFWKKTWKNHQNHEIFTVIFKITKISYTFLWVICPSRQSIFSKLRRWIVTFEITSSTVVVAELLQ